MNGFNEVKEEDTKQTFRLTQSFRFGFEVAFAATAVLQTMLKEWVPLIGNPAKKDEIVDPGGHANEEGGDVTALIARTNSSLIPKIINFLDNHDSTSPVVTSSSSFKNWFSGEVVEKLIKLKNNQIRSIKRNGKYFHSLEELSIDAKYTGDVDLLIKVKTIEEHGQRMDGLLERFKRVFLNHRNDVRPMSEAKLIFTTVHGIKGQEVDHVQLLDDFGRSLHGLPSTVPHEPVEEINLLYVALTRSSHYRILTEFRHG